MKNLIDKEPPRKPADIYYYIALLLTAVGICFVLTVIRSYMAATGTGCIRGMCFDREPIPFSFSLFFMNWGIYSAVLFILILIFEYLSSKGIIKFKYRK